MTLGLIPLTAVVAAPCVLWLGGRGRLHPGWWATAVFVVLVAAIAGLAPPVLGGRVIRATLPWFPELDVRYALTLDGLALLFALLIAAAGLLIIIYSTAYMPRGPALGRFYAYMLLFAGGMLGVVLADDLVLLYVFWELTSLASFFLIGYHDDDPAARAGAVTALIVTVGGGVAMLAGFVLLAQVGGTWQISELAGKAGTIVADSRAGVILLLIVVGAFSKSAQLPFHFWLPSAMVAPTPVSTYLHSATMVWAGVYLLARVLPVLGDVAWWTGLLVPVGLATLLLGGSLAMGQADLKALLAYSTIGALGLATALIGWKTPGAVAAAAAYIIVHGAFKGALFLVAGAVEHETGLRDIERLGNLRRAMPVTMGVAAVASLSMAAVPPFAGFLAKEAAVDAVWQGSALAGGLMALSGALSVAYAARFMKIFFGPAPARPASRRRKQPQDAPHLKPVEVLCEPPVLLWAPPAVMAVLGLVVGLAPSGVEGLAALAAAAVTGGAGDFRLWHGASPKVVAVTALALGLGGGLFAAQDRVARLIRSLPWLSAGLVYDALYAAVLRAAGALTDVYMTGRLRSYLLYIMTTAAALLGYGLARTGVRVPASVTGLDVGEALSVFVAIAASIAAVRLRLLLGSILALGVAGYSVSLIYLLLSAPDIAMTQAVIETVSVVLFVVALTALGKTDDQQLLARRPSGDGLIAVVTGGLAAVLAFMISQVSALSRVSDAFFAHAKQAGGDNVVNLVILDFRGWDTVGEITVLAIAALGAMALAPRKTPAVRAAARAASAPADMNSIILATVTPVAAPLIVLFAARMWWTGHYGPGGGFVAGLMVAASVVLVALQRGAVVLTRRWDRLMALGLLLAVGSAVVPLALGYSLLQHTVVYWPIKLPTSLVFDLGVLFLVAGAILAAVRSLVEAT
ncbi:MAG: proton-conducting transporter membrane subunit [Armatimonadota bacterium]|nr:proton-conducting transporter membrane subunit [Armatimonadota bacterium]